MISLGHRSGLFDTIAEMDFATSYKIAGRAELNERYVREWLGAMVTGSIVEYNAAWGEEKTKEYLSKAGFTSIQTHKLAHDIQNNWYVVRKYPG